MDKISLHFSITSSQKTSAPIGLRSKPIHQLNSRFNSPEFQIPNSIQHSSGMNRKLVLRVRIVAKLELLRRSRSQSVGLLFLAHFFIFGLNSTQTLKAMITKEAEPLSKLGPDSISTHQLNSSQRQIRSVTRSK